MKREVSSAESLTLRASVEERDAAAVRELVRGTGFFSAEEEAIAVELVEECHTRGPAASGYHFLFLDDGARTVAYACFGIVPMTESSYDLYWIVTDTREQGRGLGTRLLAEVERAVAAAGGGRIYVETSSRAQYDPTRRFYERARYDEAARFDDFYKPGDGKVVYVKSVASQAK